MGVLPVPPTLILPTTITGAGSAGARNKPLRKRPRRRADSKANNQDKGNKSRNGPLLSYQRVSMRLRRLAFIVITKLHLMQCCECSTRRKQFVVPPYLDYSPLVHYHNPISVFYRR